MIAKTKANKSFRGTTKYVVEKAQASIIGGNMIGTETDQLVAQFMVSRNLNPKVKEPCYHLMLSLPHSETLNNEQFASLGERHFATVVVLSQLTGEKAKLTNPDQRISEAELNSKVDKFLDDEIHQYSFFIARHNDKDHDHIHIVASRINEITTHAIKTWKQYPQSEWSARLLEKKFGLEQIPCSWESKTRAFTRSQRDRLERDGLPGAEIMRRFIDEAAQDKPTMPILIERLALRGIVAEVSYKNDGKVRGIRFSINVGEVDSLGNSKLLTMTGGGLNRHKYSFPKLQSELGISYIPERDDKVLRATVGEAKKLLTVFPTEKIPPTISTALQDSHKTELEQTDKLEQQKEKIRKIIDTAAANQPTVTQLIERLQNRGINPRIQITRTGRIQGISFESSGEEFSGTSLGANYSFSGLQRHFGVDFNLERDVEAIAANARSNSRRKSAVQNRSTQSLKKLLLENQENLSLSVTRVEPVSKQHKDQEETANLKRTEQLLENALPLELATSNLLEGEKSSEPINQPSPPPVESPISPESSSQLLNTSFCQSSQPSRTSFESNPLERLSDVELLRYVRAVEQWQKNRPTEPKVELGKSYQKRIENLNRQKANLENQWRKKAEELKQLGKPRSLLNPFGVKAEIIEEKQNSLFKTRANLNNIKLQLDQTQKDLTLWQQKARVYLAWYENPHTQKMNELAELLNSPPMIERLQRLEQGYPIHQAACYILDKKGIPSEEGRYFSGNVYRISQQGETLTIFRSECPEPLYQATSKEGILSINQFNLTSSERQVIQNYAQYLQQTQEPKLDRGPQLGR
jgi:Relaxase/Mobilisation nuclease domain